MKKLWPVLLLTVAFGCKPADQGTPPADTNSTGASVTTPADPAADDSSHLTQLVFAVEGMQCSVGCPPQVKGALQSVAGVSQVQVDYDAKQARVQVDPDTFDQTLAVKALSDAGFQATVN
jgi:copper chaperone CopZ